MVNMLMQPYFHGDISAKESVVRLREKHSGTFLVRFSIYDLGTYTLSMGMLIRFLY